MHLLGIPHLHLCRPLHAVLCVRLALFERIYAPLRQCVPSSLSMVPSHTLVCPAGDNLAGQVVRQARLKMVGSCRGADDDARLAALKAKAQVRGPAGGQAPVITGTVVSMPAS